MSKCTVLTTALFAILTLLVIVVVLVVIGSIGAIANGFFPFPLLWLLFGLFLFKPWFRHRFRHASRQQ